MPDTPVDTPQNIQENVVPAPRIPVWAGIAVTAVVIAGFVLSYTVGYFTARKPAQSQGELLARPSQSPGNPENPISKGNGIPVECGDYECLISDAEGVYGYARISGYYRQYDGTEWEWNNAPVTCDSIIPTGGSEKLLADFENLIKMGNLLNKKIDGVTHINIRLQDLTEAEKALLRRSSESNQVELQVLRPVPPGRGASTCESYLTILKVSPKPELPEQ